MSKFICLCGCTFKKQKAADRHVRLYDDLEKIQGFNVHKIFKQHWQARFSEWFFGLDLTYYIAFFSGITINAIVMSHLHWGDAATLTEAVCMGFLLPRLLRGVGE